MKQMDMRLLAVTECCRYQSGIGLYFVAYVTVSAETCTDHITDKTNTTRMWASAQRDGRPAEYRWRPVVNAAKFG